MHSFYLLSVGEFSDYCPTSFVDSHVETGTIKEGEWRRLVGDNNGATLLQDIDLMQQLGHSLFDLPHSEACI